MDLVTLALAKSYTNKMVKKLNNEMNEVIDELKLAIEILRNPHYGGIIPEGAIYTSGDVIYAAGEDFPIATVGDIYTYGDYQYCYGYSWCTTDGSWSHLCGNERTVDGWAVRVIDDSKTSYGTILTGINGGDVVSVYGAFYNCTSLTTAPVIPNGIVDME